MTTQTRYRRECISEDTKKRTVCLFKTVSSSDSVNSDFEFEMPHRCSINCLGPLTFDPQTVGREVCLSRGSLLAERRASTFKHGVVFSSRQVRIQEKIHLRVLKEASKWTGALRVGFTNVPPSARSLPLPPLAIPDLTDSCGYWAAPVHEGLCKVGSVVEFWVSSKGNIYVRVNDSSPLKILKGVDLSKRLWAMIDIYGQTCSILLLGSERRGLLCTKRSCPASEHLIIPDVDRCCLPGGKSDELRISSDMKFTADNSSVTECVVCMERPASDTLSCGHRCLCSDCTFRVIADFGTCPLCRKKIKDSNVSLKEIPFSTCET